MRGAGLCMGEFFEDLALGTGIRRLTARPQRGQFLFQGVQLQQARRDMLNMGVEQGIDIAAIARRRVLETQQRPDLLQGHVERAATADKGQALNM